MECWGGPHDGYVVEDDAVDEIILPYFSNEKKRIVSNAFYERSTDLRGREVFRFTSDINMEVLSGVE